MNKYLLMSAASVLASSTAATATDRAAHDPGKSGVQSIYATATISGQQVTFCDAVTLSWNKSYAELLDQETGCGTGFTGVFGVGNTVTSAKNSKEADLSDSIEDSKDYQLNLEFELTKKGLKSGGKFGVWLTLVTTSGTIETEEVYAGHYYFGTPPRKAGPQHPLVPKNVDAKKITPVVAGLKIKKA